MSSHPSHEMIEHHQSGLHDRECERCGATNANPNVNDLLQKPCGNPRPPAIDEGE